MITCHENGETARIHKSNLSFFVGTGMFDLLVISFFIGTTSISHHHCQESPPSPSSESITANNITLPGTLDVNELTTTSHGRYL